MYRDVHLGSRLVELITKILYKSLFEIFIIHCVIFFLLLVWPGIVAPQPVSGHKESAVPEAALQFRADSHHLPLFFCKRNGLGGEVFVFLIALSIVNITQGFLKENTKIVANRCKLFLKHYFHVSSIDFKGAVRRFCWASIFMP